MSGLGTPQIKPHNNFRPAIIFDRWEWMRASGQWKFITIIAIRWAHKFVSSQRKLNFLSSAIFSIISIFKQREVTKWWRLEPPRWIRKKVHLKRKTKRWTHDTARRKPQHQFTRLLRWECELSLSAQEKTRSCLRVVCPADRTLLDFTPRLHKTVTSKAK